MGRAAPSPALMACALLACGLSSRAGAADSLLSWNGEGLYHLYHAYSASDGLSYVEEIAVPPQWAKSGLSGGTEIFDLVQPKSIHIGMSRDGQMIDWHYATDSRHLIIPLQGDLVFDTGDGKLYHVKVGEAILAEDWTGKGHRSGCAAVNHRSCVAIDISVEPNPKLLPLRAPPATRP